MCLLWDSVSFSVKWGYTIYLMWVVEDCQSTNSQIIKNIILIWIYDELSSIWLIRIAEQFEENVKNQNLTSVGKALMKWDWKGRCKTG